MRKFKIKNKQKRKYVRKNELAQSISSVQSLTVGFGPLVLIAIAFFTTMLMYNPALSSITPPTLQLNHPVISLPKVNIQFEIPTISKIIIPSFSIPHISTFTMPKFITPEITTPSAPALPKLEIRNPTSYFEGTFSALMKASSAIISSAGYGLNALWQQITTLNSQIAKFLDPRPYFSAVLTLAQQTIFALLNGFRAVGNAIAPAFVTITNTLMLVITTIADAAYKSFTFTTQMIGNFLITTQKIVVQLFIAVGTWIQSVITAIVNAWNAFVWFLGTPFRAIGYYSTETGKAISPYVAYLLAAINKAMADLAQGGKTIVNGASYVSSTVEYNNQKNK